MSGKIFWKIEEFDSSGSSNKSSSTSGLTSIKILINRALLTQQIYTIQDVSILYGYEFAMLIMLY